MTPLNSASNFDKILLPLVLNINWMKSGNVNIADNYWGMIKNLSADVRLELISRISNSLKSDKSIEKSDSWKLLFGAFESEQSADEIIEDLRQSRFTNREIVALWAFWLIPIFEELINKFNQFLIYKSLDIFDEEKARLLKKGNIVNYFDLLIGATALAINMILVTNNEQHL